MRRLCSLGGLCDTSRSSGTHKANLRLTAATDHCPSLSLAHLVSLSFAWRFREAPILRVPNFDAAAEIRRGGGRGMESRSKIFSNVSENKNGGGGKLTFLHFRIHENAFNITQNALVPQLPGEFARRPPARTLTPGCTAPIPRFAA